MNTASCLEAQQTLIKVDRLAAGESTDLWSCVKHSFYDLFEVSVLSFG